MSMLRLGRGMNREALAPAAGGGDTFRILLEDGSGFILLEDDSGYILQEAAP